MKMRNILVSWGMTIIVLVFPLISRAETDRIFFPYVVQGIADMGWFSGITVSSTEDKMPDNAYCILKLRDGSGNIATWKNTACPPVWVFILDSLASNFSSLITPGSCSLEIESNYGIDGYTFLTDGMTASGTIAGKAASHSEGAGHILFPYAVQNAAPWSSGIAVSASEDEMPDDAYCVLKLKDTEGNTATWKKTGVSPVWAFMLDSIIYNFISAKPLVSGACSLEIESNYSIEGYIFTTDGSVSHGSSARVLSGINDINGDGKLGLQDAVYILQILTGIR